MAGFSAEQVEEIDKYLESIDWYYDSEESLTGLLHEVSIQLMNVALPTFDFAKNYIDKESDSFDLRSEMKKKSNQLYLIQLDSTARFPQNK